mmetsp:Transcript_10890/g.33635  ORF Transcript_10890/g.33635 Transcript_10890/m.33635 type:complete len:233 (+) Transcript_10890:408-1106(+)
MPTAGAGMHMEVSSGCSSFNGACMLPALTAVSLGTNPGESAGSNRPGDWPPPSGKGASVSADAGSAGGAGGVAGLFGALAPAGPGTTPVASAESAGMPVELGDSFCCSCVVSLARMKPACSGTDCAGVAAGHASSGHPPGIWTQACGTRSQSTPESSTMSKITSPGPRCRLDVRPWPTTTPGSQAPCAENWTRAETGAMRWAESALPSRPADRSRCNSCATAASTTTAVWAR